MKNIAIQNYSLLEFSIVGLENSGKFPIEYTGRGKDISPEIIIHNLSPKAKTIAITLEDTTHIIKDFTHWCIWNIAADNRIEKGIPKGKIVPSLGYAIQGFAYGLHRYAGPKPPKGKMHIYRFTVYSLDCTIELSANKSKKAFLKKAQNHILQAGHLLSEFE